MAAYTGESVTHTSATSTSYAFPTVMKNFESYDILLNSNKLVSSSFVLFMNSFAFTGAALTPIIPSTVKPITSINAQAYTTYPKIP